MSTSSANPLAPRICWQAQGRAEVPADLDRDLMGRWLQAVAAEHGKLLGALTYVFCDDDVILEANRRFLGHDYYTDIITFDYSRGRMASGDMLISLDTVASNAAGMAVDPARELRRVVVHGLLHLCGIGDKGPGERQVMEAHEDRALALLDAMTMTPEGL